MVELVPGSPASTLLVQQCPYRLEADVRILVCPCQLWRHGVLQVLARGHQDEGAVLDPLRSAQRLPEVANAHSQAVFCRQPPSARTQRFVGLPQRQDVLRRVPLGRQQCANGMGHAAWSCKSQEGDPGDVQHQARQSCLHAHQRAVHHGIGLQPSEPTKDAWEHHFKHDIQQLGEANHHAHVLHATLPLESVKGAPQRRLATLVELMLVLDVGVECGPRVLDRLPHLLPAEVVHLMAQFHEAPCDWEGGVDVTGGHGEDEGKASGTCTDGTHLRVYHAHLAPAEV
mmetsp:Transcript_109554/g.349566  ORF Transcript_109554/g.349566 Transcript_109554/m.349566 type:complete len:285 (-) Transcript_109554:43-897(-)